MTATPLPPVHFLLVDDLEENLLALEALLRRDNLVLLKARTGTEALELLLKHDVALTLLDVQMPEMNGFELAELMRGTERTRRVPIIFLTAGNADRQRRFRGYEAGAVDFLQKPVEPDILRGKAEVFFELYRQRQEVALQRDELKAATEENARLLQESREQAAALQQADRRKDEFLAMLAHELRNPLAPVCNAVEILRLGGLSQEELTSTCEIVSRQVAHMVRLVDDLLDVARIGRGKVQIRTEPCDLASIARQTSEDYRPALAAAGIDLRIEIADPRLPVNGDPTRLAQVIGNLLHNASKFTPRGGTVTVRASGSDADETVRVSVEDTGSGIAPEMLPLLFEPFCQADQEIDRGRGGLGLGLALVKGLIELHGGRVEAASGGAGKGATFTLKLPRLKSEIDSPRRTSVPASSEKAALRVLIVEDNRDSAKTLQLLLSLFGHQTEVAGDGQAGLTATRAYQPHVVVSDLGLPGAMDGFAFARAVRADQSLNEVVLIALSGYGQEEDRRRAREAGFDRFLVKPVDAVTIKSILDTVAAAGDGSSAS